MRKSEIPEEGPEPLSEQGPQIQWLSLLNLSWVMVASLAVTVFSGLWLDRRFGTAPVFILVGVALGFIVSGYSFWQTLRKLEGGKKPRGEASPRKPQQ